MASMISPTSATDAMWGAIIANRRLHDELENMCLQFHAHVNARLCRLEDASSIPDVRGGGPPGSMQWEGICSYRCAGNPDHIADSPLSFEHALT